MKEETLRSLYGTAYTPLYAAMFGNSPAKYDFITEPLSDIIRTILIVQAVSCRPGVAPAFLLMFVSMKILVACEESQTICKAFRAKGHEAYSNDLHDCSGGHPEWHLKMDALEAIKLMQWDLMIAHPECKYLCFSGERWMDQERKKERKPLNFSRPCIMHQYQRSALKTVIQFFLTVNLKSLRNPSILTTLEKVLRNSLAFGWST